jgi:hypothetical protein
MKVGKSQSTSAVGGGPSDDDLLQQQLDELQQLSLQVQQQTAAGKFTDPAGLENKINTTMKALSGPYEAGTLSPDQTSQLEKTLGVLMQHRAQPPGERQGAAFPKDDRYDPAKAMSGGAHLHKGGHAHARAQATPPVDDADPDANALPQDPSRS